MFIFANCPSVTQRRRGGGGEGRKNKKKKKKEDEDEKEAEEEEQKRKTKQLIHDIPSLKSLTFIKQTSENNKHYYILYTKHSRKCNKKGCSSSSLVRQRAKDTAEFLRNG